MSNVNAFREALQQAQAELKQANDEVEQLRVQLAGCLTAAEGHIYGPDVVATQGMYGWSVAYEKIKELRQKYDNREPYVLVVGSKA